MADLKKQIPQSLTRQVGSANAGAQGTGVPQSWEENPELRGFTGIAVYDRMRNTDPEIDALLRSINLPIRQTAARISTDGVNPAVAKFVEYNLNLAPETKGRARNFRNRISFDDFIRHALIALPIGFFSFEKEYNVTTPPVGLSGLPPLVADLATLSPRMPRTITRVDVNQRGDLVSISQYVNGASGGFVSIQGAPDTVTMDAANLVHFVNDREGANYLGRSILRSAWKHWLMKDQLLRLSGMIVERNGMGLPRVKMPVDGNSRQALSIAQQARAGETAGVAIPDGYDFDLIGVTGSTVDPLPLINYHDQAIGRSALAMFLNLGHDNGARSLGDTFVDFFTKSLNSVVAWLEETITEEVIRPLVAFNFGVDEPYPVLVMDEITPDTAISPENYAQLVHYGALTNDRATENDFRRRHKLIALEDATEIAANTGPLPQLPDPSEIEPPVEKPKVQLSEGNKVDWDAVTERGTLLMARIKARRELLGE